MLVKTKDRICIECEIVDMFVRNGYCTMCAKIDGWYRIEFPRRYRKSTLTENNIVKGLVGSAYNLSHTPELHLKPEPNATCMMRSPFIKGWFRCIS